MTDIEPISDVEIRLFELQETSNEMDNTNLDECDWVDGYNMSIEAGRKMIVRIRAQDAKIEFLEGYLSAASNALRSYQYGNSAPDLAKRIADKIDAALSPQEGE